MLLGALLWDGDRKGHFLGLVRIEEDLDASVHIRKLSKAATSSDEGNCSLDSSVSLDISRELRQNKNSCLSNQDCIRALTFIEQAIQKQSWVTEDT